MPPISLLLLVGGASLLVMGIVGGFFIVPKVVASQINKEKVLTPGAMSRGLFEKFPEPLFLKLYLWNTTNPMAVQKGEKPILQEVGPFVYDEYKWKTNVKDRNTDDSVTFNPISWFYWNQTLSGSLTGNEVVTVPNILLLSIVLKVQLEMFPMLGMMNSPVMELFRKPDSVYMNVKVRDLLFDGVLINCTVKELMTRTICMQMKVENRREVQEVSPNLFKFSFFGARNGTEMDPMRANRGSKEPHKVGAIMEFKESTALKTWRGSPCNNITGSDGGAFPPGLTSKDNLHIFIPDFCRSITLYYVRNDIHRDVPVFVYTSTLGNIAANESLRCFCRNKNVNSCPKKGSMDLMKCMGSPVILTQPHFYLAAPEFLRQSIGCSPNPDLHAIKMEIEPNTGTPLNVRIRYQFNIGFNNISKIPVMKNLPNVMHPILWMEQGVEVPDQYVNLIKDQLLIALKLIDYGRWGMIVAGLVVTVVGGALHNRQKRAVTPVEHLMSFAPNTPEGKTNPAFVKDGQTKRWKGTKGETDIWINDTHDRNEDDLRDLAKWRDRNLGQESWTRPNPQTQDPWINGPRQGNLRDLTNSELVRDAELEAWVNNYLGRDDVGNLNSDRVGNPEMEAWVRREIGGDRGGRGPQMMGNMGNWTNREFGGGVGIGNNQTENTNMGTWGNNEIGGVSRNLGNTQTENGSMGTWGNNEIGSVSRNIGNNQTGYGSMGTWGNNETGGVSRNLGNNETGNRNSELWVNLGTENVARHRELTTDADLIGSHNRQIGTRSDVIMNNMDRNGNVGAWINRELRDVDHQTSRGNFVGRGTEMDDMNREGRGREEIDASLMEEMENRINRERQGERWVPRNIKVDMGTSFRRNAPIDSRTATLVRAGDWQGRRWPAKRY